jgi:hypothetical protein
LQRVDSFSREEQRLLREVERTSLGNEGKKLAAADDPSEGVRHGVDVRLRLALLYLDEWRLDDAERFFREQTGSAIPAYQAFGRLGDAMVLSFRDQAAASNERFEAIFGDIKATRQLRVRAMLVNRNRRFQLMIVEALDRNVLNKIKLTPELEELRKPQLYTPSLAAGQRKSGLSKDP